MLGLKCDKIIQTYINMKCNFCNKEFDIKTEWLKKPLEEKIKDSLNFWATFDFDARTDVSIVKGVLSMLRQVGYFLLSVFLIFFALGGFFIPLMSFLNKFVFLKAFLNPNSSLFNNLIYLFSAIILLSLFLFVNYLMFKTDIEENFKKIFNSKDASIKCPHCGKKNRLKINYI